MNDRYLNINVSANQVIEVQVKPCLHINHLSCEPAVDLLRHSDRRPVVNFVELLSYCCEAVARILALL